MIFAYIGIFLILKTKLKKISYLFIIIGLYFPDILLLFSWVYSNILQALDMEAQFFNYYYFSHSFFVWILVFIFIFIISLFLKKPKISLTIIACTFIHLLLDIFRPFINPAQLTFYIFLSPYHFVNLLYPISQNYIQLAIYLPEFLIWIIDFSILLISFLYFIYTYSKGEISFTDQDLK